MIMYLDIFPDGALKLYQFIFMVTLVIIILSQIPTFNSLRRHINLVSSVLSIGYTLLVVAGCINAGYSKNPSIKYYSLDPSYLNWTFNVFTSISILASIFGNGIVEIQATLVPPAAEKMVKGLIMCYSIVILAFYSASVAGYWAFGNQVAANVFKSLAPDIGPALAPRWLLGLAMIFVLLQLLAIGQVYWQMIYEMVDKRSADVNQGKFLRREMIQTLIKRVSYMIFCGFVAAMLPFSGDISAVFGAFAFIPFDFVLPMAFYNLIVKPSKRSSIYWINILIMFVFTCVGFFGTLSSFRRLVMDVKKFKLFSNQVVD